MENENICNNEKRIKMNSGDISVSLASLLKSFSQNSSGLCDTSVTSELNVDLEHFDRNILRNKHEKEDYNGCNSESFLTQLSNGDRNQTIDYDKRSKLQFDGQMNKSLRENDNKSLSRFTNTGLSSNNDALNSFQMHSMSALKTLLSNQNGQIYLLVKGDTVQALDGSSNLTGIFDTGNYSHNVQLSTDLGDDISSSENCSTMNNHPSIMMAAQQLHMSNNLSTAELIQKLLESPQTSCTTSHLESMIGDHKMNDPLSALPSLSSSYHQRQTIQSDHHNNNNNNNNGTAISNYYTCSIDSTNEADVTLLVDEDNSESNSQFTITNNPSSSKNDNKQIFLLNGNIKLESRQSTTDDVLDNSVKTHFNSLLNDRHDNLDNELYNDISNNFVQSNIISSFNTTSTSITTPILNNSIVNSAKRHKRIKTKPLKNIEINAFAECGSKSYSPTSPIFSMSVSQLEDNSSKESVNGNGEIKELKRKSSHNEVERRRRDRINTWIGELQNMLPNSEKLQLNRSKSHILKAVYDYFRVQTDQLNDLRSKNEKLDEENREKTAIIKKLESEKEVLLNQLQYINQAVTSTVKITQESLNRSTVNQYRLNPIEKVKVTQPYRITNIYTNNDMSNFATGFIIDNQNKKRKLHNDADDDDDVDSVL